MAVVFSNNATTALASSVTNSATSLTVQDGSVFPTLSGADYTYITLEDLDGNVEIVKLTARSGNTLTVARAQDGTSARAFSSGSKCELRLTAALLNEVATQADTDTNTTYTAGSGLSLTGTEFANTAPDQTVALTGAGATSISGTYPNFTITSTDTVYTLPFTDNSTNWNTAYGWGDHSTAGYATQSYVGTAISNLVDSSPATLDTLNELAAALGDDPNFATTVSTSIGTKWTQDNTKISNWDTAYSWGDHASAGYLTSAAGFLPLTGGTITGSLSVTGKAILNRANASVGAPNTANHDTGTRIELYNGSATAWYAIGIEDSTMWFNSDDHYRFYTDAVSKVDFDSSGVVNAVGGYKVNGTTVIDSSRNLTNIGTISSADDITTLGNIKLNRADGFVYLNNQGTGNAGIYVRGITSSSTLRSHSTNNFRWEVTGSQKMELNSSGVLNAVGGYQVNGTTVIDSSRNLTNISNAYLTNGGALHTYTSSGYLRGYIGAVESGGGTTGGLVIATSGGETISFKDGGLSGTLNAEITGGGDLNLITGTLDINGITVIDSSRNLTNIGTLNGGTAWTSANDGSGSGLDADLLDGIDSTGFVKQLADGTSPDYQTPSSRRVDPTTSNPTNAHHAISTFGNGGNVTGQLATHFVSGQAYTRGYNSAWSAWRLQWDSLNDGSGSGLDADTVDGWQASSIVKGSSGKGTTNIAFGSSANSDSGFYDVHNNGTPTGTWYSMVNMAHYGGNHGHQIAGSFYNAGELYNRNNSNTNFSGWTRIWNAANDGSGSGLDADLLDGQQPSSLSVNYANSAGYLPNLYAGGQQTNPQVYFNYTTGLKVAMTGYPNVWSDTLWINGYSGGDVVNMCALHTIRNGEPRMWISSQSNRATSYGTAYEFWSSYNDGSGSGLDADLLDGMDAHNGRNSEPNKIVRTDGNGYIQAGWINTDSGDSGIASRLTRIYSSYDNYLRYSTLTDFKVHMGLSAKNSYSRRIDYTSDANYHVGSMGHSGIGANEVFHGGSGFFDIWSSTNLPPGTSHVHGFNALHYTVNSYGSTGGTAYGIQVAGQYNQGGLLFSRGCSGGSFSGWRRQIDDYNYNSYSPTLTGGGASGSWNVTAARATRANGNFYIDDNYGNGIVGVYSSYRYQGVFAMGDAYKLAYDGTTTGSLYGLAWSHPNAGGAAGNLTDHGLLVINNGAFKCAISNSIVASSNITAYSDERLKKNWRNMPENFVSRLAEVRVGIYDRIDEENVTQVGVSAQSLQVLLPEAIITAKDEIGTLSVNYGGAALASAVELAKVIVEQEKRIERLERLIEKLTGESL